MDKQSLGASIALMKKVGAGIKSHSVSGLTLTVVFQDDTYETITFEEPQAADVADAMLDDLSFEVDETTGHLILTIGTEEVDLGNVKGDTGATGPQGPKGDAGESGSKGDKGDKGDTGATGNGIISIIKTDTSGLVDTYTITFTDGTTTTFTVTNGQDGQGSGDMTKAVYDSAETVANAGGLVAYLAAQLANYYTKSQTYTQTEVNNLISAITTLDIEVVASLPTQDISTTTIYLVPSADPQTQNVKDEYINTDGTSAGWELIGSTAIDLSGYVQKSQTAGLLKNDGTVDTEAKASQATVNGILNGTNIDSFGDVETALNGKADTSDIPTVSVTHTGTASSTGVRKQQITVNNVSYDVDGSAYMEQSVTLSTSQATDVVFTNAIIADGTELTFSSSIWDLVPDDMVTTTGVCTVTLPKWTSAVTIGCRLRVR